ncbi:MAG: N-acyl homoserine lactonase family protein [Afipia sp.]|nr:N-acyl homoserine lactonase family protein [Afipia sp.]
MKMHILSGGRLRMKKSIYYPEAGRDDVLELPISCVLLRHAQGNVLFDTGCHPSIAENPEARWGGLAKYMTPIMPPGENVLTGLQAVGLSPDDVDVVVCSHFHTDHCGCNAFFKKSTIFVHAKELEVAQKADANGYFASDWKNDIPLTLVNQEQDLFGDDRINLVELPGHTPGTMGALVKLDRSGEFLLTSDAVNVRANLDNDHAPLNTWNADLCRKSFAKVREIEKSGATVICSHDEAEWKTLRKGTDAYD